jgi:hypothetical protein
MTTWAWKMVERVFMASKSDVVDVSGAGDGPGQYLPADF